MSFVGSLVSGSVFDDRYITSFFSVLFVGCAFYLSTFAVHASSPIDAVCGIVVSSSSISEFPTASYQEDALCAQGSFSSFTNTTNPSGGGLSWMCEGLYGGNSVSCSVNTDANVFTDMVNNAGSCGTADGQAFRGTATSIAPLSYSNNNNAFLGNLCQGNASPLSFQSTARGWDRECPGTWSGAINQFVDTQSCTADLYFDSSCGVAAGIGHQSTPTNNLCAPGYVSTMVRYNTETNNRERECEGGGGGAISSCTAWSTNVQSLSPTCNPYVIDTQTNTVAGFPGTQLCGIGEVVDWTVDTFNQTATWKCGMNNQTTASCGGVSVQGYAANPGVQCNGVVNGQSYERFSQLVAAGLCENNAIPQSVMTYDDKWERTCGSQSCEAFKETSTQLCGYATNTPSRLPPSQGLCSEGQVVTQVHEYANTRQWVCSTIQDGGFCSHSGCQVNFPDQAAVCESFRIVHGVCDRETSINPDGFHTPNEVIQSGLCEDGYPSPLIPQQDMNAGKWSWACEGTPVIGQDSPTCYAQVGLPEMQIEYSIPRPIPFPQSLQDNQLVDGRVTAHLTGYDPLYLNFTTPYNQDHRLFTQNGSFRFVYEDWAGNTGDTMVFVDWIGPLGPQAFPVYSTQTATSGDVIVRLSGYDSAQNPTSFSGPCLTSNQCSIQVGAHPYDLSIVFTENGEGTFTVTDAQGNSQDVFVQVDTIDKTIPTATLHYSTLTGTREDVIVQVVSPSEPISIANNGGHASYTFTENGSFVFEIVDEAGNTNTLMANVTRIDKDLPGAQVSYSTTSTTDGNVVATLTQFTEPGITVVNNNGSNSYTFTQNGSFAFVLEDAQGDRGTVVATVDRINKPILQDLIQEYEDNICHRLKHRMPIDIGGNEHNYEIITMIRNCIMKGYRGTNNHYYFYPRKNITRAEFLRVVGIYIKMTTDYQGELLENVSDQFMNVMEQGEFFRDINEADARGLLFYTPLLQQGIHRIGKFDEAITQREARYILEKALDINGMDTRLASRLISEKGFLSRGETAYIFATLLSNVQGVAMGNNLELLKALAYRLDRMTSRSQQREFIIKLLVRVAKIPDPTLKRVGLHPHWLKEDLKAIIQSSPPDKKDKEFIIIKTIMSDYLQEFPDPFNNEIFNDGYQFNMFDDGS